MSEFDPNQSFVCILVQIAFFDLCLKKIHKLNSTIYSQEKCLPTKRKRFME